MTNMFSNYLVTLQNANQDSAAIFLALFFIGICSAFLLYGLVEVLFKLVKYLFILIGRDFYSRYWRRRGIRVTFKN
ncbi:putative NAD-dependent epimerase/dehydratase [Weissella oryzae SG25]|uniref:Putative NAD-dependent epimerase/dehydratase n=1 Tax=Weissella oryzae (strain DSM 25784 / JCM 18191 / LMG 30913 / SG25) TaxID=1329250 RepID=A0A069CVQ4_WEIOS|nr:putative NAD-dependent epimerase/dehydratase [Weissella oryzae SG25]